MTSQVASLAALYPVLATMPVRTSERLLANCRTATLPAGAVVFDEGDGCEGFPFVISGGIRVLKTHANGRTLPLYRVGPGESCIITSSCLLGHSRYNARGICEQETVLMLVPAPLFNELLAVPEFRDFVFHLFADRMADLMELVEEVAFRKLDQRLANRLLGHGRSLQTTHQQLADELGSVREMVSRLLKGFAEQKLVRLSREQIEILDPAGLRQIADDRP